MCNIRLQAHTLARRCKISHWLPHGADGWVGGRTDGCFSRMIIKISRMSAQPNFLSYGAPYSTVKIFKFAHKAQKQQQRFSLKVTKYALF